MQTPKEKVIFALDVDTFEKAEFFVKLLVGRVGMFKVGKQLFTAFGPAVVRMIKENGGEVFLDLKYHDIPTTVALAVVEAARLGAKLVNLHALGGYEMMKKTVEKLKEEFPGEDRPKLLAVTILTSSTNKTLNEMGIAMTVREMVVSLALMAKRAGMDGVIASPQELKLIRESCGPDFLVATPGVRSPGVATNDQARVMTPGEAIIATADYIVCGREISEAKDPVAAADNIVTQVMHAERHLAVIRDRQA